MKHENSSSFGLGNLKSEPTIKRVNHKLRPQIVLTVTFENSKNNGQKIFES